MTGMIFGIFLGATAFSLVLRGLGGDDVVEKGLKALPFGPEGIVIAVLFFLAYASATHDIAADGVPAIREEQDLVYRAAATASAAAASTDNDVGTISNRTRP